MKPIFRLLSVISVLTVSVTMPAIADSKPAPSDGTTDESLRKTQLPIPQQIKVAVLPFSDYQDDIKRRCVSSVYSYLLLEQAGFSMLPIVDCFEAVTKDKALSLEERLSRSDAARIGQKLGATWAVYGEVKSMGDYGKADWLSIKKTSDVILRVSVVNCESGEMVYWRTQAAPHESLKQLGKARPDKRTRAIIELVVGDILRPLLAAASKHPARENTQGNGAKNIPPKPVPSDKEVLAFVRKTWPDIYRQAFREDWSLV